MPDVPKRKSVQDLLNVWNHNEKTSLTGAGLQYLSIREMPSWDMICFFMPWKRYLLGSGYFDKERFGYTGVYRLIALEVKDDITKPATLNRVCGQDMSGTLYIGEAIDLSRRLNQLRRTAEGRRERSHGAVIMLRQITALDYPPAKLGIALMFTGYRTKDIERDLICAYMNTFGDTPPLNYKL